VVRNSLLKTYRKEFFSSFGALLVHVSISRSISNSVQDLKLKSIPKHSRLVAFEVYLRIPIEQRPEICFHIKHDSRFGIRTIGTVKRKLSVPDS
jgi:hypothetical protein